MEIGIRNDFQVWHQAGHGVPDPDVKRMGFFITTSDAQTLLEFDLSQVGLSLCIAADAALCEALLREGHLCIVPLKQRLCIPCHSPVRNMTAPGDRAAACMVPCSAVNTALFCLP